MSSLLGKPDLLNRFSPEARAAFERFKASGDSASLGVVVTAIVAAFMPAPPKGAPHPEVTPEKALIADLGFDSIAIAETVFFFEDLFGVSIGNRELLTLRTVRDLCEYIEHRSGAARVQS